MVLLLNYLPWIVLAVTFIAMMHFFIEDKQKALVMTFATGGLAFFLLVILAGSSYLPKGEPVARNDTPAFEVKEAQLKNDLRELDEKVQADLERKLDWKDKTKENKDNDG